MSIFELRCCFCCHITNYSKHNALSKSVLLPLTFHLGDVLSNTREDCVTHKNNALDNFVKSVRSAAWDISLCFCSLWHSAAHVVPRSHMGFQHKTSTGAGIVQKHWRGNKHKQHALSCLEVPLVPVDASLCHHCVRFHTHGSQTCRPQAPNGADGPSPLHPVQCSTCSFQPAGVWDHAVINDQAAQGGEVEGSSKTVLFNC